MKTLRFTALLLGAICLSAQAQTLQLHIDPTNATHGTTTIADASGHGYTATLMNGAAVRKINFMGVIDLKASNGYVDLGSNVGTLIGSLNDFTMHAKLFIPTTSTITENGNFIWTFSKSANIGGSPNGCLFANAKDSRYAITLTNYNGEATTGNLGALPKGEWLAFTYVQSGTNGKLYVNGTLRADRTIALRPSDLGETAYNWLGRACYSGDAYLKDALIADFRIYDGALSVSGVQDLEDGLAPLIEEQTMIDLENALNSFSVPESIDLYTQLPQRMGAVQLTYSSERPDLLSPQGVMRQPTQEEGAVTLPIQVTFSAGEIAIIQSYATTIQPLTVPRSEYTAYLFTYFTGNGQSQEQIHFALSYDGISYTPLNDGRPVISSDTISLKQAVRDPHILRGEDGCYYMVVTDMRSGQGWSSNDGLVLLKSADLVNWTHSAIDFPSRWPARFDRTALTQVWAPQTIYDPVEGKYMVYFSIGESGAYYKIYYAYANEDFTDLITEPQVLYDHGANTIDGDIIEKDGLYHIFFKTENNGNGIQKATSDKLVGGTWTPNNHDLQQTTVAVEGSGVFPLIDSDKWVLMYDCYSNGHYQFCTSTDLEIFTLWGNAPTSGAFTPRHGTVIPITADEQQRLTQRWPGTQFDLVPDFTTSTIQLPEEVFTVRSITHYDLQGLPVRPTQAGLYIRHTEYTNGQVRNEKIHLTPSDK